MTLSGLLIAVIFLAFVLAFFDTGLGMGFGTTIAPILILLDFNVLEVIPAVLLVNTVIGLEAAFFHHIFKNVNFKIKERYFKHE